MEKGEEAQMKQACLRKVEPADMHKDLQATVSIHRLCAWRVSIYFTFFLNVGVVRK